MNGLILYDQTSGANAALDTGPLDVSRADLLTIILTLAGGSPAGGGPQVNFIDANGGGVQLAGTGNLTAAATLAQFSIGITAAGSFGGVASAACALPRQVRLIMPAQGVGVTCRMVIVAAQLGK
ncbi:MAG TPA: hypothetical protein VF841_16770 [Anaeromyxobacter sp.]